MHRSRSPRSPYYPVLRLVIPLLILLLPACGAAPTGPADAMPTQTRAAELAQLATLTAPTATANVAPTQTRAAELALLATITAPTATPNVVATETRSAELAQLATITAPTPSPPPATLPVPTAIATRATPNLIAAIGSFVGRVAGSELFIAIVSDGTRTLAYICDGQTTAQWFTGAHQRESLDLTSAQGTQITAQFDTSGPERSPRASGRLRTVEGRLLEFSATLTSGQDNAGLYRTSAVVAGANAVMGVIVLPDGSVRGAFYLERARENITPVTDPSFGANVLTATIPGAGTFTAPRLTAPPP